MEKPTFNPFANKPDITDSSKKLYTYNLSKLNGGKVIKDLKFLGNDGILEKLSELKPNTRRTYLISIVSALKDRPEAKHKKLYAKYYEQLVALNKELKDNSSKTEKVKENWIEQEQVVEKQKEYASIIAEIADKKKISEEEFNKLLNLVVISLYTLQQPRRNKDYTDMMIVKKTPDDKEYNYLDATKWEWVFNNYKTEKTYKQKIIEIPGELKSILQVYLKFHPQSKEIKKKTMEKPLPFLVHYNGDPIRSSVEMTRMLNKIFGKKVGCSMLRAIYLTGKYGDTLKEMKNDVDVMGTSIDTANNNYIKQN